MNRFDDLLPEEIEPQHKELITLLQYAYSRPVMVPPAEQAQIIARVQARLVQADHGDAFNRDMPLPQIGVLDSFPHQAVSPAGKPRRDKRPFRLMALLAAAMLIAVLLSTSLIILGPRLSSTGGSSAPALMLSPNVVDVKSGPQQVKVHIVNFPAGTRVQLSHDVQEDVTTVGDSSTISIGADGSANATILVNSDWAIGFDQVYAEDIATHYTASAQLQVLVGSAPSKPAHLMLSASTLDFSTGIEGSDTILPLNLMNSGSGSITWSASSNQPWLLVSPVQGMFSQSQSIVVAAQRINLTPGTYTGAITISSNVGAPQTLSATVEVTGLSSNVGPVLALNPAVLSFTTTDGSPTPPAQWLTLNNPGTQPLNWSLTATSSATASNQLVLAHTSGVSGSWLSADQMSGSVPAGSSQQIGVSVNSNSLLPGTYLGDLVFIAPEAVNTPQIVSVSLTVQPHCGLVTTAGYLSFTAVEGKTNPGNQSLGVNATASCAGAQISWKAALSSSGWLSATPGAGTLNGTTSEFISIGANATGLPTAPRPYLGFIAFSTQKSTQTVMVELTVQQPPTPGAPVMGAAPLNLNFSNTQGQPNPKGEVVTITNNGGNLLKWNTSVTIIASSWLMNPSPLYGTVLPNQSEQLVINVDTSHLSPGIYAGQITLNGMDSNGKAASGSPQVVSINLVVQPPCTLTQPSSSSLAFSGVQGGFNPISQSLLITETGNCAWPLTLSASAPSAPWLSVQFPTGSNVKGSGQSVVFVASVNIAGLLSGPPVSANFTISATDSAGTVATGSPQTISVTLTVLPPCLTVVPPPMTFTAAQGQASPALQSITLSETGTCSRPVSWVATGDAGSSSWLSITPPAPDTGSGSPLIITVNSASLVAGTYTGTISVSATDSTGRVIGPAKTITVTVNVTPISVSGTVIACQPGPAQLCTTSAALPGATLTLLDSSNATGNYSFANLSPGNYTVNITGTDARNVRTSSNLDCV